MGASADPLDLADLDEALTQAQIISNVAAFESRNETTHDTVADDALQLLKTGLVRAGITGYNAEMLIGTAMSRMQAATEAGAAVRTSRENDWYV
jgi:hypothetical protein